MAVLKAGTMAPDGTIDVVALHARSWAAVKLHLSPEELAYLTTGTSYAEAQHLDPTAPVNRLPLYESKYGYILLLKSVVLVAEPVWAIVMVSLVGALGILALLVHAARRLDGIATLSLVRDPVLHAASFRDRADHPPRRSAISRGGVRISGVACAC